MVSIGNAKARSACLGALALAPVLFAVLLGLVHRTEGVPNALGNDPARGSRDAAQLAQAIATWEALWSEIEAHGSRALRPAQSEPGQRPAGDTVFMRYRNLWGAIDPQVRIAFQLAAASSDPERKLALIAPFAQHAEPLIRLRAYLEQARIARRQGDLAGAERAAQATLAVAGVPERLKADAWLILADCAWQRGQGDTSESALDRAIAADPGFWDARRLRLELLARRLEGETQHSAACLERTRRLIEDLGALPTLAEDQTQFRDLADRLARTGPPKTLALVLAVGLGYRWAGDNTRAQATLALGEQVSGRLPARCEALIRSRIDRLLAQDGAP
ncbi:tetratricopeptide repeat protein [Caldichromatium japonicum]|uniref:Tetratricopeptide repeat protein n=1 Tax=Caldichromatium japonicum TaxID=2699430 RepID=A0A6G7VAH7_9GAMM|nr:tetratricopeptide repeat protein [Caldichromatium japonicum]QIK37069.1 tetratricopeptide repeat protein [Caldichromatium japonicum]